MGGKPRVAAPDRALAIAGRLAETWPDARCELDFRTPYELLVATILSAQSTDRRVNLVTPELFRRYPDATALAAADPAEIEALVHSTGFYRNKTRSLLGMARKVVAEHGGAIPDTLEALIELPGVARKTANVVLGAAFGKATGVVVDTHVTRLAGRLGLSAAADPVHIERDLMAALPRAMWIDFGQRLIWHGRRTCHARKPACADCPLVPLCPSASLGDGRAAATGRASRA